MRRKDEPLASICWFWRDWRASTARACLSPLARGIYRELLDGLYATEECRYPDDDAVLAAIAGVDLATWAQVRPDVLRWLPLDADGFRYNPRTRKEWKKSLHIRHERSIAGRNGAKAKRDKKIGDEAKVQQTVSKGEATLKPHSHSPSHSHSHEEDKNLSASGLARPGPAAGAGNGAEGSRSAPIPTRPVPEPVSAVPPARPEPEHTPAVLCPRCRNLPSALATNGERIPCSLCGGKRGATMAPRPISCSPQPRERRTARRPPRALWATS